MGSFTAVFDEPDCSIKIETISGFSGSYQVVRKQGAQPVSEWK
jgi:hypothetical protein